MIIQCLPVCVLEETRLLKTVMSICWMYKERVIYNCVSHTNQHVNINWLLI